MPGISAKTSQKSISPGCFDGAPTSNQFLSRRHLFYNSLSTYVDQIELLLCQPERAKKRKEVSKEKIMKIGSESCATTENLDFM